MRTPPRHPEPPEVEIPAPSDEIARDWALVLASQQIPCRIAPHTGSGPAAIRVPEPHAKAALEQIRQSTRDSLDPNPVEPVRRIDGLRPAVLTWVVACAAIHLACGKEGHPWREFAMMSSEGWDQGEVWRPVTALFLHVDLQHLLSNLVAGYLLLSLGLTRWRARTLWLVGLTGGIAGNLAGLWTYPHPYTAMGASGMILSWLGWMTARPPGLGVLSQKFSTRQALAGGLLLFVYWGTSPDSDVTAHGIGFATGLLLGLAAHGIAWLHDPVRVCRN